MDLAITPTFIRLTLVGIGGHRQNCDGTTTWLLASNEEKAVTTSLEIMYLSAMKNFGKIISLLATVSLATMENGIPIISVTTPIPN